MRKIYILIFIILVNCGFIKSQTPVLVKDIYVGLNNSNSDLTGVPILNGIIFSANDGVNGMELWFSDGTNSGTSMIKDILPGNGGGNPSGFFAFGSKFLFAAHGGAISGRELWITDGTTLGTNMVKDINPGGPDSNPNEFNVLGSKIIFKATTVAENNELWITDGTISGTILVKDIWPGVGNSNIVQLTNSGLGYYYFVANDGVAGEELWRSDGTNAGTYMVKDILPGSGFSSITILKMSGGLLYFLADDGVNGKELWRSDGTSGGTFLLKDINSGTASTVLTKFEEYNNKLVFTAYDPVNGTDLWESNGTAIGTYIVNLSLGSQSTIFPSNFYKYNNDMYFFTKKMGVGPGNDTALFYKMMGSISNLTLIRKYPNIDLGTNNFSFVQTNNNKFVGVGKGCTSSSSGNVFFVADATPSGSNFVSNAAMCAGYVFYSIPFVNNNWIYPIYPGTSTNNYELNNIDYSSGSVTQIKNINPSVSFNGPWGNSWNYHTYYFNNNYYFIANDGSTGNELWKTDGTNSGTSLLMDIYPGTVSGPVSSAGDFNAIVTANNVFFYANNGTTGRELWAFGLSTGLKEHEFDFMNISLYPNPTSQSVKFTIDGNDVKSKEILYKIYNSLGQLTDSGQLLNNEINVSRLNEGCYFVELKLDDFSKTMKFIKN